MEYKKLIENNDIITLLETGTTTKPPDTIFHDTQVIQHNPATSNKKKDHIHNGKGTCILAKKGILAGKAHSLFNNDKIVTAAFVNK